MKPFTTIYKALALSKVFLKNAVLDLDNIKKIDKQLIAFLNKIYVINIIY